MYSKCHMSLIMEMCRTHQISDTQEMSGVFLLKMYMKYEISDVTGHVQEMYRNVICPCLGIVPDM